MGILSGRFVTLGAISAGLLCSGWALEERLGQRDAMPIPGRAEWKARISIWDESGGLVETKIVSSRQIDLERQDILVDGRLLLSFESVGFLPQTKWMEADATRVQWEPRLQAARVFLYSAEGRGARKRRARWPEGTISLGGQLGQPIDRLLGFTDPPSLEPGHYLAGDVRYIDGERWPKDGMLHVSMDAPTLARPLQYTVDPHRWGESQYPIHVFPIPPQQGLREFHFELDLGARQVREDAPGALLLLIQSERLGREVVIATRGADPRRFSFYSKANEVQVLRSISSPWTLSSGAASPQFVPFDVRANELGSTKIERPAQMELTPPQVYIRFPRDFGVPAIPGARWSLEQAEGSILGAIRFWFEGGSAFLEPGRYTLICTDSDGVSFSMEAREF